MVKKSICVIILASLTLHCAIRIGFLSYLHQQRYDIAYFFGFVEELPISECRSSFYSENRFDIPVDEQAVSIQGLLAAATEIVLFNTDSSVDLTQNQSIIAENIYGHHPDAPTCDGTNLDCFKPPRG